MTIPRIDPNIRTQWVSWFRQLNAEKLRALKELIIIQNNDEPVSVLIPYAMYLELQESIQTGHQEIKSLAGEELHRMLALGPYSTEPPDLRGKMPASRPMEYEYYGPSSHYSKVLPSPVPTSSETASPLPEQLPVHSEQPIPEPTKAPDPDPLPTCSHCSNPSDKALCVQCFMSGHREGGCVVCAPVDEEPTQ